MASRATRVRCFRPDDQAISKSTARGGRSGLAARDDSRRARAHRPDRSCPPRWGRREARSGGARGSVTRKSARRPPDQAPRAAPNSTSSGQAGIGASPPAGAGQARVFRRWVHSASTRRPNRSSKESAGRLRTLLLGLVGVGHAPQPQFAQSGTGWVRAASPDLLRRSIRDRAGAHERGGRQLGSLPVGAALQPARPGCSSRCGKRVGPRRRRPAGRGLPRGWGVFAGQAHEPETGPVSLLRVGPALEDPGNEGAGSRTHGLPPADEPGGGPLQVTAVRGGHVLGLGHEPAPT